MFTKEEAYAKIAELVERFSEQVDNYKRDYNETQTKQDFINPFFEVLGWDMNNKQGAWEKQQTTTPDKLEHLNTRIQYTEDKINKLVYQLYGLNEEEVRIVEGE